MNRIAVDVTMRADLEIIQQWIPARQPRPRPWLWRWRAAGLAARAQGRPAATAWKSTRTRSPCAWSAGVNVIEQDLDLGLDHFADDSFDVVVMTQTLQVVHYPDRLLKEMLRVGKTCIITFPNFGHWRCRWYLATRGRMPVSEFMPYTWYNTPNIHFCTFRDFEALCRELRLQVLDHLAVDNQHRDHLGSKLWPNLLGEIGIYRVTREPCQNRLTEDFARAQTRYPAAPLLSGLPAAAEPPKSPRVTLDSSLHRVQLQLPAAGNRHRRRADRSKTQGRAERRRAA